MTKDNEKKKDNSKYIMYAVIFAFVCFLFLNILAKLLVIVFKLVIRYWYVAIILALVIIFMLKRRRKK